MQWKPNVTVAAIVENDGKYLLVQEYSDDRLVFNQPAGHLEKGESLIEAVKREVKEETAWDFEPESVTGIYMYPNHSKQLTYLRVSFQGKVLDHDPRQELDDGILRAVWLSKEEIESRMEEMRSTMVLKCINDYLAGNAFPLEMLHYQIRRN